MDSPRGAAAKRAYNKTGASRGKAAAKLERKHKVAELVAEMSCTKAEWVNAAVEILQRVEKPSACRVKKEKMLRAVLENLEGQDCLSDASTVSEVVDSLLYQLHNVTVEPWEVFAAAFSPVPGNRRPKWAKLPFEANAQGPRRKTCTMNKPHNSEKNAAFLMQDVTESPVDVISAVWRLLEEKVILSSTYFSITQYFQSALRRLDPNNCRTSLGAVDVYRRLKELLDNEVVSDWEVLRLACSRCWPNKASGYPKWARRPKEISTIAEEKVEQLGQPAQAVEGCEASDDSSDEFAEAFDDDATIVPMNSTPQPAKTVATRDRDADSCYPHEKVETSAIEKRVANRTFITNNEDEMTIEQLKKKLNSYRMLSRHSPQQYLQEFIRLNNKIQGMFEHSQERIRLAAQRAREELRDPSPSPERPVQKRERTDIMGYIQHLEELEKDRGIPSKVVPEKKPKKRARKATEPQPKTVHEAILKDLEEPANANVQKQKNDDDDLFNELFGGRSDGAELADLEAQLELDLSEL